MSTTERHDHRDHDGAAAADAEELPTLHGYSPHEHRPLGAYAGLTGTFLAATGAGLLGLRARGRTLPERPHPGDVVLIGVATHKLSRVLTKDKSTSFLRAPFTRFQEATGHGEVSEEARGHGAQLAIGELLICPYCMAPWIAAASTVGLLGAPRLTRMMGSLFAAVTVSDFLQLAYRAAEERA